MPFINKFGGAAPSLTASGVDVLAFATYDGGDIYHGFMVSTDTS